MITCVILCVIVCVFCALGDPMADKSENEKMKFLKIWKQVEIFEILQIFFFPRIGSEDFLKPGVGWGRWGTFNHFPMLLGHIR
jgi:hypothetical protein